MNISSPSSPKKIDPKVFLFIGPPGGRKTTLAMQFPNICFFDCDGNLDGPRLALTKLMGHEPTFGYYSAFLNSAGEKVESSDMFDNLIDQMDDLKPKVQEYGIKFICVDGLRIVGELIKQKVMKKKNKDMMETRDWDPYKSAFIKLVVVKAKDMGVHAIFTCHERELWEKSASGDMMKQVLVGYEPLLNGGIQDAFAGFFTDVWRITTTAAPGGASEQTITTMPDGFSKYLKSSVGLPGTLTIPDTDLAWPILEPYMKACL